MNLIKNFLLLAGSFLGTKPSSVRKPSSARLSVERLEDRRTPSVDLAVNWVNSPSSARAGDIVNVSALISEQGSSATGYFPLPLLASTPMRIPTAARPGLHLGTQYVSLGPWSSTWVNASVQIPSWWSGPLYPTVAADPNYWLYDINRSNNAMASWYPTQVTTPSQLDLAVDWVNTTSTAKPGDTISVYTAASNQGNAYSGSFLVHYYVSNTPNSGMSGTLVQTDYRSGIAGRTSTGWSENISLPSWLTGGTTIYGHCRHRPVGLGKRIHQVEQLPVFQPGHDFVARQIGYARERGHIGPCHRVRGIYRHS